MKIFKDPREKIGSFDGRNVHVASSSLLDLIFGLACRIFVSNLLERRGEGIHKLNK